MNRLVTPDEPSWLTNSANFYRALANGDLHHTYQIEHPGVTATWIGTAAFLWRYPAYADDAPRQFKWWLETVDSFLQTRGYDPLELLVSSRVVMVLVITLVLTVAFWKAVRLLGFWPAFVGFLLVATDPFHIAHSRLLHLDALLSSLMLLSLLAFMNYLCKGGRHVDLVVSGVAAGLAWLTKSPTLFLIPLAGLLLLLELEPRWRHQGRLERKEFWWVIRSLVLWGAVGGLVFVLLWPAMWVDPVYTVWRVLRATVGYAAQGHEAALYFNGHIIEGDPGFHFYPVAYLWRTTPVALIGLGLTAVVFVVPKASLLRPAQQRVVAILALFAILFTLFMSLGAKKFDRYLLPIYGPLDLIAAIGWVATIRWLLFQQQRVVRAVALIILFAGIVVQIRGVVSTFPYYLSYYNPLLGGTARAPRVMTVGWGEGLDQAADYLNSHQEIEDLQVAVGVWNGSFSYFFKGNLQWSVFHPDTSHAEEWRSTDFLVLYINQWQRGRLPQELLDYLAELRPVRIIRLQGLDYVYVYDIREVPPPDYLIDKQIDEMKLMNPNIIAGKPV